MLAGAVSGTSRSRQTKKQSLGHWVCENEGKLGSQEDMGLVIKEDKQSKGERGTLLYSLGLAMACASVACGRQAR